MRDMARSNTKLQAKNSSTFAFIKPNIIEIQRPLEYEPPQTAIRSKWPGIINLRLIFIQIANINNFMHLARQQEGGQVYERSLDWMLTLRTQTQSDLSTREKQLLKQFVNNDEILGQLIPVRSLLQYIIRQSQLMAKVLIQESCLLKMSKLRVILVKFNIYFIREQVKRPHRDSQILKHL
eukprot:403360537